MDNRFSDEDTSSELREDSVKKYTEDVNDPEYVPRLQREEDMDTITFIPFDNGIGEKGIIASIQHSRNSCTQKFFDSKEHTDPLAAAKGWIQEIESEEE